MSYHLSSSLVYWSHIRKFSISQVIRNRKKKVHALMLGGDSSSCFQVIVATFVVFVLVGPG